jgi:hypothetical protein
MEEPKDLIMRPVAKRTRVTNLVRALCGFAALWIAAPVLAAEKVVIGTPSRGLFEFPTVVAISKGFYQEAGFIADRVQMQPLVAVKALMSGDVDYLLAWGSAVRAAVTECQSRRWRASLRARCMF